MVDKSNGADQVTGFLETNRKIEAGLLPAIEEHVNSSEFDAAKDGLDFLKVKNSLMLSYLIDLTFHIRQGLVNDDNTSNNNNRQRLTEMKTTLDKTRPLEKKMRYQLDKLLTATSSSTSFASGRGGDIAEDPLQYRPDPKAFQSGENESSSEESDSDDGSTEKGVESASDDDDDLEAAKATLVRARLKGDGKSDDNDNGLYRAPRLSSMPYPLDEEQPGERQKRLDRRLHTSELAQTLKSQYGDAPEQEDVHGASDFGKQRDAARRLAERTREKIRFEEESMVRLTETRKEKKLRKQLLRQESSNLSAISDLGNLVRGVSAAFQDDNDNDAGIDDVDDLNTERYDNGKRKRSAVDSVSRRARSKGRKGGREAKNSLQMALYGTRKEGKSKKKKRR